MQRLRNFIQEHRNLSIAVAAVFAVALIGCCVIVLLAGGGEEAAPEETIEAVRETQEPAKPTDTVVGGEEVESTEPIAPTETPEPTDTAEPTDTPEPTGTAEPTDTPEPTNTPEPTPVPPTPTPETIVPVGTSLVGEDIEPGIYVGFTDRSCYWERLSDLSGDLDSIIANGNNTGQFYIEVLQSDRALTTDCELLPIDVVPAPEEPLTNIGPGIYLVGRDIEAGTWRGQASEGTTCYWERLSCVLGTFECIIANDNAAGQFFVEVAASDYAVYVACEMEKVE